MDYSMINKIQKAKEYAQEPERITFNSMEIEFKGNNNTYTLSLDHDGWNCTCPGFGTYKICPHIMALEKILAPMLKRDPVPYAVGQNIVSDVRKAKRYSEEVERIKFKAFDVTFRGSHQDHKIIYENGVWDSPSSFFRSRGICSRTMALEKILGSMVEPITVSQPQL